MTCIMSGLLNIYLMHISFAQKGILVGYIAVTWGVLPRYNDKQSIWESYVPFKNTNKWWRIILLWRLKLAYMTTNNGRHSGLSRFHLVTLRKQQIKTIKTQISTWDRHEKLGRAKCKQFFLSFISNSKD